MSSQSFSDCQVFSRQWWDDWRWTCQGLHWKPKHRW